jgi:hypothetical protein
MHLRLCTIARPPELAIIHASPPCPRILATSSWLDLDDLALWLRCVDQSRAASITAVMDLDSIKPLIDELDATTSISMLGFA